MTTYLGNKQKAFRKPGHAHNIIRSRSEGRLKAYSSATDTRAWSDEAEQKRKYILELIQADRQKTSLGNYVPVEVLINSLLANKDAVIAGLQKLLDECRYQEPKGNASVGNASVSDTLLPSSTTSIPSGIACGAGLPCPKKISQLSNNKPVTCSATPSGPPFSICAARSASTPVSSSIGKSSGVVCAPGSPCPMKVSQLSNIQPLIGSATPSSIVTPTSAFSMGAARSDSTPVSSSIGKSSGVVCAPGSPCPIKVRQLSNRQPLIGSATPSSNVTSASAFSMGAARSASTPVSSSIGKSSEVVCAPGSPCSIQARQLSNRQPLIGSATPSSIVTSASPFSMGAVRSASTLISSSIGKSSRVVCAPGLPCPIKVRQLSNKQPLIGSATPSSIVTSAVPYSKCAARSAPLPFPSNTTEFPVCGKGMPCPKKMRAYDYEESETNISDLTTSAGPTDFSRPGENDNEFFFYKTTATKAIEQLEALHCIIDERNSLREKLQDSLCELECLKNLMKDPCLQDIESLEQEIERLQVSNTMSPTEEIAVLQKETEILKTYCKRIHQIREENINLQLQLQRIRELTGVPNTKIEEEEEESNDPADLNYRLKQLKSRFAKFNDVMDERDKLKYLNEKLQAQLAEYENLAPEEFAIIKKRSFMLNEVVDERNNLQKRLEEMQKLESEIIDLKQKADRTKDLEKKVAYLNLEIGQVKLKCTEEIRDITEQMHKDCQRKNSDIESAGYEIERLRDKAKEADILKLERDKLKLKLQQIAGGDLNVAGTSNQSDAIDDLTVERDLYKAKSAELEMYQCECNVLRSQVDDYKHLDQEHGELLKNLSENELCIKDQENQIQKLMDHIDRLSHNSIEQQDRYTQVIHEMRSSLEENKSFIAGSEELLASVGLELKSSIKSVATETTSLKSSIEELTRQLGDSEQKVGQLQDSISELEAQLKDNDEKLRKIGEGTNGDHERFCKAVLQKECRIQDLENQICSCKAENQQLQAMIMGGFGSDEHLEKLLKQSKRAVKKVAELL